MHKYNTEGIVLKSTNYADKDKIYTILTRDYGKVRVLARGVRKITSRRAGNLDTLNYVSLKLTESSGFKNLDEAVVLESFRDIKNDLSISMSAYYLAEIVFRSVEEDDTSPERYGVMADLTDAPSIPHNGAYNSRSCAACGGTRKETPSGRKVQ